MPFYYTQNLISKQTFVGNPWEFAMTEAVTEQIRKGKSARQEWYKTPSTRHSFYTGIEPYNPNCRVSREDNPPKNMHAFHSDFDAKIPDERVQEVIDAMDIKPAWTERSLGGNIRLIWTFSRPLPVDTYEFCMFVLQQAQKWLNLDMLPALDEGAWTTPTRLLANGCQWKETGHGHIPEDKLQAFFVDCGMKYRFQSRADVDVPIEKVEAALKVKYADSFATWPGDFVEGAQGPSFWIPLSTSPMSAIVKRDGMFSFSAHADKVFYSWSDLLGPEFVKDFSTDAIAKATKDIYWDGKTFWRIINGIYSSLAKDELMNYFEITCGLTNDPGKGKKSLVKIALEHIYQHNRIFHASPYIFRPPGVIEYQGRRCLNTYVNKVIQPAAELTQWGRHGKFPWISALAEALFAKVPLEHYLAWIKYFYECGLYSNPQPGPMIFIMGEVECGKTLFNRQIIGRAVGGFYDAEKYIMGESPFNEHMLHVPLWCLDDDTVNDNGRSQSQAQARIKKTVANGEFNCNQKFQKEGMTEWMGRLAITANLDYTSSRILGTLDNGTEDKCSLFRCLPRSFHFGRREEIIKTIIEETPYFLRWLVDHTPPDFVIRHSRFGYKTFHDESLMDQAHQTSRHAPFKELLIEALRMHFETNPTAMTWEGTVTELQRMIFSDTRNQVTVRNLKLDQTNRYLENVQKEGLFKCEIRPGPMKTRLWVFHRTEYFGQPPVAAPLTPTPTNDKVSIFSK